MQSNYFSIERTIYRQLDAVSCYLNDDFQRKRGRAHLSFWFYRPRLCLSWYLPTDKLLITNSTCGLRPSHYTLLRMETGLTPTIILLTN